MAHKPRKQRLDLTIDRLGARGDGIAGHNGHPVLVAGALPGERVTVETGALRDDGITARVLDLLETSPQRDDPPCRHAD
ncbi:MAG: hypothetical protein GDA49_08640 [Rhodospirillales bacterium]|nr:hypothetical protein [Rhodospirillales bacterium]